LELFFGVVDFVDVVIVEDVFADVDDGEGVVDEDTADDVVDDDRADDTVILVEDVDVGVVDQQRRRKVPQLQLNLVQMCPKPLLQCHQVYQPEHHYQLHRESVLLKRNPQLILLMNDN
jgi:hypothetical protein